MSNQGLPEWMSWGRIPSAEIHSKSEVGLCWALSLEACHIALKQKIQLPLDPQAYEIFYKKPPNKDDYFIYLESAGFKPNEILKEIQSQMNACVAQAHESKNKAREFFNLFETEFHITNEQISKYIDEDSIYYLLDLAVSNVASVRAKTAVLRRYEIDPKQKEKAFVKECWELWQNEMERYKGNAAFARDMLQKYETLTSQPVIERWCREWKQESST